ncbi:hypothetical protein SRABI106_00818 [Rahnella aquatilis]|nr:hypothetical protein SRABI106_00818 [Rahnella aquatilis]
MHYLYALRQSSCKIVDALSQVIDKDEFIAFGDEFLDDGIVVEGVVTFIINDAGNQVFDDTPCI